jgi:hypothetical protein
VSRSQGGETKLEADIKLMWQTYKGADGSAGSSTPEAVKAAKRVFGKVNLIGMTRSEVVEKLGDPQKAAGSYFKHSAREVKAGTLFYRFDTGIYGWQFNLLFDDQGKVLEVKGRIIE